jgi:hypothetical protein
MVKKLGTLIVLVALTGCGSDAIKDLLPHASCNAAAAFTCQDYSGPGGAALTNFQSACAAPATYSSAECAVANRIGSCTYNPIPGVSLATRYYSGASSPWTAGSSGTAAAACTAAGTAAGVPTTFTPN